MAEYRAVFKCRLCGGLYSSAGTKNKELAIRETTYLCLGIPCKEPCAPGMTEVHTCEDGSFGIADFLGWKWQEKE